MFAILFVLKIIFYILVDYSTVSSSGFETFLDKCTLSISSQLHSCTAGKFIRCCILHISGLKLILNFNNFHWEVCHLYPQQINGHAPIRVGLSSIDLFIHSRLLPCALACEWARVLFAAWIYSCGGLVDRTVVVSIQLEIRELHDEFLESFCSDTFNYSYISCFFSLPFLGRGKFDCLVRQE